MSLSKLQFMVTARSYIIHPVFLINLDKVLVSTKIMDNSNSNSNSSMGSHKMAISLQMGLSGKHFLKDCRERI